MGLSSTGLPSQVLANFIFEIFVLLYLPEEASDRYVLFLPLILHPGGRIVSSYQLELLQDRDNCTRSKTKHPYS